MKIRSGFVSNSSSSSFIISVNKKPTNEAEVIMEVFGENTKYVTWEYGPEVVTVEIASKIIFEQLKNQKPITKKKAIELLMELQFPNDSETMEKLRRPLDRLNEMYKEKTGINVWEGDPIYKYKYNALMDVYYNKLNAIRRKRAATIYKKFKNDIKNQKPFVITLSDNNEDQAILEHGCTFCKIPHIRISHH